MLQLFGAIGRPLSPAFSLAPQLARQAVARELVPMGLSVGFPLWLTESDVLTDPQRSVILFILATSAK